MTPSNTIRPSSRDSHGLRIRTAVKAGIGPTGTNHGVRLRSRAVPTHTRPLVVGLTSDDSCLKVPLPLTGVMTIAERKGTHRLEVRTGTKAGGVVVHE